MVKPDGREAAQRNEEKCLKAIFKYGFLRTRDISAVGWHKQRASPPSGDFVPVPVTVSASMIRMAQRTLLRLRESRQVFVHTGPDGSSLYGLAEAGARRLRELGVPASSSKDWLRRFSESQYHHRRLSNELAIVAKLQGYRVSSEREIAMGLWLGGTEGICGKRPDVLVRARSGKQVWALEIERSARNKADSQRLLTYLGSLWPKDRSLWAPAPLPGGHELIKVVFISNQSFAKRLSLDLKSMGWTDELVSHRIFFSKLLYVTSGKFITLKEGTGLADPA